VIGGLKSAHHRNTHPIGKAFSFDIYNNTQQFTLQKSTQKPILFTVYKR